MDNSTVLSTKATNSFGYGFLKVKFGHCVLHQTGWLPLFNGRNAQVVKQRLENTHNGFHIREETRITLRKLQKKLCELSVSW